MDGGQERSAGTGSGTAPPSLTRVRTRRSVGEQAIKVLLAGAAVLSVLTTTGIVITLLTESSKFFGEVPIGDFFFGTDWAPLAGGESQSFGVAPLIWSTLYLTFIALLVADSARPRGRGLPRRVRHPAGAQDLQADRRGAGRHPDDRLRLLRPDVLHAAAEGHLGIDLQVFNGLSGGIILGILVLPTIASVSEDAMSAVPQSLREGAFGLGAAKWQVVVRVVFPAALSGVVAALVLGASRAIGETVVILVASGNNPNLTFDLTVAHQNMAAFIANVARADVSAGSVAYATIFAVGTTLFVMTFLLNLVAIRFVRKYRQVYE